MSLFSLRWFKSQKEEELEALKVEEQRLKNELLHKELLGVDPCKKEESLKEQIQKMTENFEGVKLIENKPYKSASLVNDVLTVVLLEGDVITKSPATVEDFSRVRSSLFEFEVISAIASPDIAEQVEQEKKEIEKAIVMEQEFKKLEELSDFEVKDGAVYLTGIHRSLPELLVKEFLEIVGSYKDYETQQVEELLVENDRYQALRRFFMWCCLNPRAEVADKLYDFLKKNDFKITKQGFFVALRNVVRANDAGQHSLVDFVTNAYTKIKAVWKKKPVDFTVYRDEDKSDTLYFTKISDAPNPKNDGKECLGNLQTLYDNLPTMAENHYTDNWSHTFDIRIGKIVNMDPATCSWSTADCAEAGLHFAGHTAPYILCGDTTIFTLHNPLKVVGIGEVKGRCWEYLPFMTTTTQEADEIMNDAEFDFLQLDEQYAIDELEGLAEKVKAGFAAEATKHDFNLPGISVTDIRGIVSSLEEMKAEISDRVSVIK